MLVVLLGACSLPNRKQDLSINDTISPILRTIDSIEKGTREIKYYDSSGNLISVQKFDSLLSTGRYRTWPKGFDVELEYINQKDIDRIGDEPIVRANILESGSQFLKIIAKDIDGHWINTSKIRGNLLVLNYWFLACRPCRTEIKGLNEIVRDYKNKGVTFLGITFDKREEILVANSKLDFHYTIIPDQVQHIKMLRIEYFPSHIIVDNQGKVVFSFSDSGPRALYWLRRTIDSCLARQAKSE